VWEKLSDQEKKWLQQAADESVIKERVLWAESVKMSLEEVKKAGVIITYPDKEPFAKKVEPIYEMFHNDEKIYSLIQRIKAVQ
jgi:TRAP-type C4-dicarboxylate transport system substrate-binding protein